MSIVQLYQEPYGEFLGGVVNLELSDDRKWHRITPFKELHLASEFRHTSGQWHIVSGRPRYSVSSVNPPHKDLEILSPSGAVLLAKLRYFEPDSMFWSMPPLGTKGKGTSAGNKDFTWELIPSKNLPNFSKTWWLIGGKVSAHGVGVGSESTIVKVYSFDDSKNSFRMMARTTKVGPGLGISGGLVYGYVTGVTEKTQLIHYTTSGWDMSLSLGEKWKGIIKSLNQAEALANAAKIVISQQELPWENIEKLMGLMKTLMQEKSIVWNDKDPGVAIMDIPFLGGGTEVGLYYKVDSYEVY